MTAKSSDLDTGSRNIAASKLEVDYFRFNATFCCVGDNVVEPDDIQNMDVGVGSLFLAVLCAEIVLLPVWAAVISISGMMRLPVVLATTSLNRATSKIWM